MDCLDCQRDLYHELRQAEDIIERLAAVVADLLGGFATEEILDVHERPIFLRRKERSEVLGRVEE
jgi:hypothetical protein